MGIYLTGYLSDGYLADIYWVFTGIYIGSLHFP